MRVCDACVSVRSKRFAPPGQLAANGARVGAVLNRAFNAANQEELVSDARSLYTVRILHIHAYTHTCGHTIHTHTHRHRDTFERPHTHTHVHTCGLTLHTYTHRQETPFARILTHTDTHILTHSDCSTSIIRPSGSPSRSTSRWCLQTSRRFIPRYAHHALTQHTLHYALTQHTHSHRHKHRPTRTHKHTHAHTHTPVTHVAKALSILVDVRLIDTVGAIPEEDEGADTHTCHIRTDPHTHTHDNSRTVPPAAPAPPAAAAPSGDIIVDYFLPEIVRAVCVSECVHACVDEGVCLCVCVCSASAK